MHSSFDVEIFVPYYTRIKITETYVLSYTNQNSNTLTFKQPNPSRFYYFDPVIEKQIHYHKFLTLF